MKNYPFVDHDHDLECQTVSVELKNGASASQGRKTGMYQRKEVFGKLPYWTSKNYAIWYNSKAKAWAIGTLASLGTNSQGILGIKGEFRWPFDKKYRWMYYGCFLLDMLLASYYYCAPTSRYQARHQ